MSASPIHGHTTEQIQLTLWKSYHQVSAEIRFSPNHLFVGSGHHAVALLNSRSFFAYQSRSLCFANCPHDSVLNQGCILHLWQNVRTLSPVLAGWLITVLQYITLYKNIIVGKTLFTYTVCSSSILLIGKMIFFGSNFVRTSCPITVKISSDIIQWPPPDTCSSA